MAATSKSEDYLPYASVGLSIGDNDAALTTMVYGTRVHIEFSTRHCSTEPERDGSSPRQGFLDLKERIDDDPAAKEELEDWLMQPCIPHLRHLATNGRPTGPTSLQDYFHPDTLHYVLQGSGGGLHAHEQDDASLLAQSLIPCISMSCTAVQAARAAGIPLICAADLEIVRPADVDEWEYDALPTTVRLQHHDALFHLKAADEGGSFAREVDTLPRLRASPRCVGLAVSRLAGLPRWQDELYIAGILVEHIPDAKTLDWICEDASPWDRARWLRQVRETVKEMHTFNVIWADAKPANVLVDANHQAWVVDFGGGYSSGWIDPHLEDTKSGDLQALAKFEPFLRLDT